MRMGGVSCCPAAAAAGDPTHALFADKIHSIPDNLMALLGHSRAWNCSAQPARSAVRLLFAEPPDSSGCRQPVHRFHGTGIVPVLNISDGAQVAWTSSHLGSRRGRTGQDFSGEYDRVVSSRGNR